MNRFWVIGDSKKVLFPGKSVFIFLLASEARAKHDEKYSSISQIELHRLSRAEYCNSERIVTRIVTPNCNQLL